MRGSFADYEKQQLMKQIDFTLEKTKIIADCEALLRKVKKKPIDWSIPIHLFAVMGLAMLVYLSSFVVQLPEVNDLAGLFMPFIYVFIYSLFVFVFNRMMIAIKHVQYDKELRQEPIRRREALAALTKHSEVPSDYWKYSYLLLMKSYLKNHRADTMKECLNLLEDDIRRLKLENKLKKLEQHLQIDHTHLHHVNYDSRDRVASGYYEETTFIEETTYVDDELVEDTVYEETVSNDWDEED